MDFQYRAVNAQGQAVSGQIIAGGERGAVRRLRQQDLTPLEIISANRVTVSSATRVRVKRASNQGKAMAIRELATLLQAGISLAEAVESIGRTHTDSSIGRAFAFGHGKLRSGESFSQA